MKKTRIVKNCLYCGNPFEIKLSHIKKDKGKYCSRKCFYIHRRLVHTITAKCKLCDNKFETLKSRPQEYCSRLCFFKSNTNNSKNPWFNANRSGKNNSNWQGGITSLHPQIRNSEFYISWRKQVFERDGYTCQECFRKGLYIEVHHKKPFSVIFRNFLKKYNQFSPFEDKEILIRLSFSHKPFWNIKNGKTLCEECHNKTKKGIKKVNYDSITS